MGAQNAKSDMERYRAGYPGEEDEPGESENLRFYKGERASIPDGDYIDNIHKKWWGNYALLERHHGYIQWLFPIREHGMNYQSQKLQPHEIKAMRDDPRCMQRLIKSYSLILDFFGVKLANESTGELERNPDNYLKCYRNLNTSSHNYLRITRILKCLGEFGYEHMKSPFIEFFVSEVYEKRELRNIRSSLGNYWLGTIRDDTERARLERLIAEHEAKERGPGNAGVGAGARNLPYAARAMSKEEDGNEEDDDEDDSEDDSEDEVVAPKKKTAATVANPGQGANATVADRARAGLAANAAGVDKEDVKKEEKDDDKEKDDPMSQTQ